MARSNDNDVKYSSLPLAGWGSSLDLTGKGHPIAKRVWKTKADMLAYVADIYDSAVPGIILTVTADGENNGAYLVQTATGVDGATEASVIRLATGDTIKLHKDVTEEIATLDNGVLKIEDMRSRWESDSF
jgi:hypothetical protein